MFLKNLISILISIIFCVTFSYFLNNYTPLKSDFVFISVTFFVLVCLTFNFMIYFFSKSKTFTELLIIGLCIKLLLSFIAIFIFSYKYPFDFFNFSIHFSFHYILFTIFEIIYSLKIINLQNSKPK